MHTIGENVVKRGLSSQGFWHHCLCSHYLLVKHLESAVNLETYMTEIAAIPNKGGRPRKADPALCVQRADGGSGKSSSSTSGKEEGGRGSNKSSGGVSSSAGEHTSSSKRPPSQHSGGVPNPSVQSKAKKSKPSTGSHVIPPPEVTATSHSRKQVSSRVCSFECAEYECKGALVDCVGKNGRCRSKLHVACLKDFLSSRKGKAVIVTNVCKGCVSVGGVTI
jgi:hypothetical protein